MFAFYIVKCAWSNKFTIQYNKYMKTSKISKQYFWIKHAIQEK